MDTLKNDFELTGEQFLEILKQKVEEDYKAKVHNCEMMIDDETKLISARFFLDGHSGYVRIDTGYKAE